MRGTKKILLVLFFFHVSIWSYGQSLSVPMCDLYMNRLEFNDTIHISIKIYLNRNQINEQVLIYKDKRENYFASLDCDNYGKTIISLDSVKINTVKLFEKEVLRQSLISNTALYMNALVEYQVRYQKGFIFYSTKKEFYSLCHELLK